MSPSRPAQSGPFEVLHVCMGNICRSPMAERLFAVHLAEAGLTDHIGSASVGTGPWHEGEPMQPRAAREVIDRGGDPGGFAARWMRRSHVEQAGLILTATAIQAKEVVELVPAAAGRTFVLGEFARLLDTGSFVDVSAVDPGDGVAARAGALVRSAHRLRVGLPSIAEDDLADPYGCDQAFFSRIADRIEVAARRTVVAIVG